VQAALPPFDGIKRLLATLCNLDTYPQERFDRIIDLIFQCKSRQGKTACDASRQVSICGHTLLQEAALVFHDALLGNRIADNPVVLGAPRSLSIVYGLWRGCHHVKSH
jgi:hypothetical protein